MQTDTIDRLYDEIEKLKADNAALRALLTEIQRVIRPGWLPTETQQKLDGALGKEAT